MPADETRFPAELEAEVEAELTMIRDSHPDETRNTPPSEWLYDPADAEREDVGLRNILGATEGLDGLSGG